MTSTQRFPASQGAQPSSRIRQLEERLREAEARCAQQRQVIDKQRAEIEALTDRQEYFRTIVASEPACVKLISRDGTILSMNPAGLAMAEVDDESEAIGVSAYDLIRPEDHDAFRASLVDNFEGHSANLEYGITGMRGTRRRMESFSAPLRDAHGDVQASLMITHDVTARTRDQAELHRHREHLEELAETRTRELERSQLANQRAERLAALGTLAAGLAHELNNPLGTIRMAAEFAVQAEDHASTIQALEDIREDVARCSRIVNSVLQFSRDEPSEKWALSLNAIAKQARDRTRRFNHDIEIVLELEEELPKITGNETEIERVLINVLQNAIQASAPGQRIVLRTRSTPSHTVCEIKDTGYGMSTAALERAFDPFYTTRIDRGGTGLGLSVSHGIVRDHGGSIELASEPGRGTQVTLKFASPSA